jgi:hypothetical protein
MITIFVKYSQFSNLHQFVYEFALENAKNAVLELQKWKMFWGTTPRPTFSPET